MNQSEKIELILNILGINNNIESKNIIDDIFYKIEQNRIISEFNAIIIQEMIKDDVIPPIILKRSKLLCDLKNLKKELKIITDKYEIFKEQKAKKNILNSLAQKMLIIQNEIELKQEELKHL